eukprot:s4531_g7.t1
MDSMRDTRNYASFYDLIEAAEEELDRYVQKGFAVIKSREWIQERFGSGTISRMAFPGDRRFLQDIYVLSYAAVGCETFSTARAIEFSLAFGEKKRLTCVHVSTGGCGKMTVMVMDVAAENHDDNEVRDGEGC